MVEDETTERRRVPRADVAIKVECLADGTWMIAHDVSLGGMLVTTSRPRWPGQLVAVRFQLPGDEQAIRCTCRVVDLVEVPRGVGLSLKFLRLAPEALLAVHRYVDKRPVAEEANEGAQAMTYIKRMVEDCAELGEIARTPRRKGHLRLVR
jgi:hypothetical protein